MRIDSAGKLLVGQNSDSDGQLCMAGVLAFSAGGSGTASTTNARPNISRGADGQLLLAAGKDSGSSIRFDVAANASTNAAEVMRIDSSGNILCVSNGTQSSLAPFFLSVVGKSSVTYGGGSDDTACLRIEDKGSSNSFFHGIELRAKRGGDVRVYAHDKGSDAADLVFATDNSGIAEHMRITSDGKVMIGLTSSVVPFQVAGGAAGFGGENTIGVFSDTTFPTTGVGGGVTFSGRFDSGASQVGFGAIRGRKENGTVDGSDYAGALTFATRPNGGNMTERMRLTSIGTMQVSNMGSFSASNPTFHDFSANSANDLILRIRNTSSTNPYGFRIVFDNAAPNDTTRYFHNCVDNVGLKFQVNSNGGIQNFQSNDSNLCDEREKKNIVSLDTKWDKVKSWELKKFHYNEDADTDDLRYGVIAQQIEEHCPEVLTPWIKQRAEDAVLDEDGNVVKEAVAEIARKGVKEQQMMWMAIKALQEAQTRIETLEAKVAALEAA